MAYKGESASFARKVIIQQGVRVVARSVLVAAKAVRRRVNARVARRVGAGIIKLVLSARMVNFHLGLKIVAVHAKTV